MVSLIIVAVTICLARLDVLYGIYYVMKVMML